MYPLYLHLAPSHLSFSFFRNAGAVAGVFVLVGLAAASIVLWVIFAVRRRRRTRRLEHDTAVSATLAAAGFHRTPLDDDDDPATGTNRSRYGSPVTDPFHAHQRSSSGLAMSSIPSAGRASAAYQDNHDPNDYNPYTDHVVPPGARDGYISTPPPPTAHLNGHLRTRSSSGGLAEMGVAHFPYHSASGSHEPLLASHYRGSLGSTPSPPLQVSSSITPHSITPPSESARQPPAYTSSLGHHHTSSGDPLIDLSSGTSSVYSSDNTQDDRLDPGLRQRLQDDGHSAMDLRDEEDYSRPVLGVII